MSDQYEFKGKVVKSTGKTCIVRTADGEFVHCSVKGKFRMEGLRSTNPVAVGDNVSFLLSDEGEGAISQIEARSNYIIRKSVNLSKQMQIIACNVDMCFLLVTLKQPSTSTGFIDRFLVSAEAFKVPVTIVINKIDLITSKEDEDNLNLMSSTYQSVGYEVLQISVENQIGLDQVFARMSNQVCMISGHSGVGKTSLLNAMEKDLELPTNTVSDYHEKGQHTTTFAEMHPLSNGGFLIDTPGIKGFGLVDVDKDELSLYFKEFFKALPLCKFHNCKHINEPQCEVKRQVESGEIAEFRYHNYVNIYTSLDEDKAYRVDPYK